MPDNLSVYQISGQAYLATGQIDKAEALYTHGIQLYPSYAPFHGGLGEIALQKNDVETAKEQFLMAITAAPNYEPALDRLGTIYYQLQQFDSSLIFCQRLLDLHGGNDPNLLRKIRTLQNRLNQIK